jgi:hypothetical protein
MSMGTPVTSYGPFEFTDSKGKQVSIPLSALTLNGGQLTSTDPGWSAVLGAQPAKALWQQMVAEGLLAPMPAPAPAPAMLLRAASSGTAGNNITITITVHSVSPPANDPLLVPFDLNVTETDTYAGQTAATISQTLVTAGALVQVVDSIETTGVPDPYTKFQFLGSPAQLAVEASGSPGGTLFVLAPRGSGPDSHSTYVTIAPDPGGSGTFSLQATWTKTASGLTLATLASAVQSQLGYEITISKPSSGAYSVPAAGSTTLTGGGTSSNASAILFTGLIVP